MRGGSRKLVLTAVILITAGVHSGSLFLDFNSFWDHIHVYRNPFQAPLSPGLVGRAFTEVVEAEYTPLRSLSNSLDWTIWGERPFGHHLTGYLIFLLNTALVFLLVERLTASAGCPSPRRIYLAGLTALFFGIHPLKVQVVAWVTTRDYQLGACFYLLCLLAYLRRFRTGGGGWYALSLLGAILASLAQAMAVSLPLVLLLLDWYPLRRFRVRSPSALLFEKAPFVLVALLTAVVTWQIRSGVRVLHPFDLPSLAGNVVELPAALLFYAYKTFLPLRLAPVYPMEITANPGLIIASWILLAGLSVFAFAARRSSPALPAGIVLSLVLVLPAGGLVRSGASALADRYVQLANLPLLFGIAWLVVRAAGNPRIRRPAVGVAGAWALLLAGKTLTYTALWDRPIELTRLAYDSSPRSRIMEIFMLRTYNNVAARRADEGRYGEALEACRMALEINPADPDSLTNLGVLCIGLGKDEEARAAFARAAVLAPGDADAHFNLGLASLRRGMKEEARAAFEKTVRLNPAHRRARQLLAEIR